MIKNCCYYCQKFETGTCKDRLCYNALAHPNSNREGKWFCEQYEGKECGETITGNGSMSKANSKCWVER